jgi:hypothetical protein
MTRRLWLAYLIAPWGTVAPLLLLWLGAEAWARTEHWHYDLFITTPWHFAALVAIRYIVDAALLPVYFALERRGWRGWKYYVPTAILAAFVVELAIDAATTSWAVTTHKWQGGIGAVSAELAPLAVVAVVSGLACGGLFSIVLPTRPLPSSHHAESSERELSRDAGRDRPWRP